MKYCLIFKGLWVNLDKDNKHQIPNSSYQIITRYELPKFQTRNIVNRLFGYLGIGYWNLFGI